MPLGVFAPYGMPRPAGPSGECRINGLGGAVANSTGALVSPSTLMRAAFFALAYYLGAKAGLALVVQPENISALWPANPIAVALVLLSPPRMWPAFLLALFAGHLLAVVPAGTVPAPAVLGLGVGNAIEVFLAAWLMRRYVGAPGRRGGRRSVHAGDGRRRVNTASP